MFEEVKKIGNENLSFEIRPIERKDNQSIQKIIQISLEEVGLDQQGTAYFDPQLGSLFEYYQQEKKSQYWVAVEKKSGQIAGGIGIGSFGDHDGVCELQKYYVGNSFQKLGIGRMLFDEGFAFAKQMGYKFIYIETMDLLAKANNIYEHYGFQLLDKPLSGSKHGLMNRWYIKKI